LEHSSPQKLYIQRGEWERGILANLLNEIPPRLQSKPFNGKISTYINAVQGAKIKLTKPTSPGKLKDAKAVDTRRGASN
jgi:hypothetical protein